MKRRRLAALKVTTFLGVALGILLVGELTQAVAESWLAGEESSMVSDVNAHRKQHSLKALGVNSGLKMMARRQAQRMVMAGKIYHNPNIQSEADKAVPDWMLVGENVGVGPDEPSVQDAFLESPPHHRNIDTKNYNIVGLGVMAADNGAMYFTQNFAESKKAKASASSSKSSKSTSTKKSKSKAAKVKGIVFERPEGARPASEQHVNLLTGILAMFGEALSKIGSALSKLAFWA